MINKDGNMIYEKKERCTACEACMNICPVSAITFIEDNDGSEYPTIDKDRCIDCGLCKKVCLTRKKPTFYKPISVKAVSHKNNDEIKKSASGALFFGLAKSILDEDGVVVGASYENTGEGLIVSHKLIKNYEELKQLQGSKYTRSYIKESYKEVEEYLKQGKKVLFTGTPCQIAGLYNYIGKDYDSLTTADVICHGVPEQRLFRKYLGFLEQKHKCKIESFCFRDKQYGWGLTGSAIINKNNKNKKKKIARKFSSYYSLFVEGSVYRKNCYSCEYAKGERVSDITMGDYWGIQFEHPETLIENGGKIDPFRGVSCAIINTRKGKMLFDAAKDSFITYDSSFEKIQRNNNQLNHPTKMPEEYNTYVKMISVDYS